jgi:RNA polymerase sigma factor (sigma-70 family)
MGSQEPVHNPISEWSSILLDHRDAVRSAVGNVWRRLQPPGYSADDLCQLVLSELLERPRETSNVVGLAVLIAERRSIDRLRKELPRPVATDADTTTPSATHQAFLNDRLQRALAVGLDSLAESERDLLRLRFLEKMTLEQLAGIRGTSHQSTYVAVRSVLTKLRHRLLEMAERDGELKEQLLESWPSLADESE